MKQQLFVCLTLLVPLALSAVITGKGDDQNPLKQVCNGLNFPEGPAWDGHGHLVCSNCNSDYLTRVDLNSAIELKWLSADQTGEHGFKKTNGMTYYKDGSLFICDPGANTIVRVFPDHHGEIVASEFEGHPFEGPNDLAFDPHGNLYFTAPSGSGRDHPTGPVYRIDHSTHKVTRVAKDLAFPNGLAFSADAKTLYLCESQHNRILQFAVNSDGSLGEPMPYADLSSDGPGEPDGMAVDVDGNLWIAHYGAHTLLVVNKLGAITHTYKLPVDKEGGPTNVEFAGKDMRTLFVTDPSTGALYKMRTPTAGLKLFCAP